MGHIALISRGTCNIAVKCIIAANAGAIGAVVYDNMPGPPWQASLEADVSALIELVPIATTSRETGAAIKELLAKGTIARGELVVRTVYENITTLVLQRLSALKQQLIRFQA
jgi:carboxypeptidase Q